MELEERSAKRSKSDEDSTAFIFPVTVAIASISTDDFKVDPQVASEVLASTIIMRASGLPIKLVLVDTLGQLNHTILPKDVTIVGKGFDLISQNCPIVAVGCNKLFKSGGDRANIELHKAFGNDGELTALTKEQYPSTIPNTGQSYPVHIPKGHPLREKHNLEWVIHVLGPNMNPNRLDYLDDPALARIQLAVTYDNLFNSLTGALLKLQREHEEALSSSSSAGDTVPSASHSGRTAIPTCRPPSMTPPSLPGLSLRPYLQREVARPYQDFLWFRTEENAVIYDGYPKAFYHFLVIPLVGNVAGVSDLRPRDLSVCQKAHELGRQIIRALPVDVRFQMGYHALPSLTPLHLHIISTDLSSAKLTSKKHWNSFAHPDLFIQAQAVEKQLAAGTGVQLLSSHELHEAERGSPQCHVCGLKPAGSVKEVLAKLKAHKCTRL